ncbi:hypothetical protein [Streptomyces sp. NBC_01768]|uniref:restriction endonuclease subunit S n=1 Tax=Streptomyces sp. NBC_01768 TaxID=2975938 RepID=UPI002DDA798D|nr:hypothetical protein [Streptomyces sp. NBC_01768]WSC30104.1 hypothetical protein OG902_27330 [Streptomyces sp. NBC_01768]
MREGMASMATVTTSLEAALERLEVGIASVGPEGIPGDGEWGVIRLGAVTSGQFDPVKAKRLPTSVAPRPALEIRQGDVLMVRVNGARNLVGSVCVVGSTPPRLMLSDLVMRLVPARHIMDPHFLGIALSAPRVRDQILSRLRGTSGQFQLPQSEIKSVLLPCPPLVEQRRIVEVIDAVSAQERAIEASIAKLRRVRQGVLQNFMDRLARSEFSVDWSPVRDVGSVRMGKQLSPDSRAAGGQFPYLRVANVLAGCIDYSDVNTMGFTSSERSTYQLQPGDILLNEGQSLELVGRSAIYRRGVGEFCFQNTLVRFRAGEGLDPNYAQVVFGYWLRIGVFAGIAKKTTSIAHLGGDRFGSLQFPLVSPDAQSGLVSAIAACDGDIESGQDEIRKLRALKLGLVDDLLAGRP